jgi:thermostable 8-oxoguanine DNA glycosylase
MLLTKGVQTEEDLRHWITMPLNGELLLTIKGVGPKTLDYMKMLVGLSTVAIDRHIRNFVAMAGVQAEDYNEIRLIIIETAEMLKTDPSTLDHQIWMHLSRPLLNRFD